MPGACPGWRKKQRKSNRATGRGDAGVDGPRTCRIVRNPHAPRDAGKPENPLCIIPCGCVTKMDAGASPARRAEEGAGVFDRCLKDL
jgi:hypothetical protein